MSTLGFHVILSNMKKKVDEKLLRVLNCAADQIKKATKAIEAPAPTYWPFSPLNRPWRHFYFEIAFLAAVAYFQHTYLQWVFNCSVTYFTM